MEFKNPENENEFFVTRVKNNTLATFRELRTTTSQIEGNASAPGEEETETITTTIVRKMASQLTTN
jgi:hypothetical protein